MMPPPVAPDDLRGLNWVLCTHAHSDHMDPGTLPSLAKKNRDCRFVVPRAEAPTALARGIPASSLVLIDAGETVDLGCQMRAEALPSAHEDLARDRHGNFRNLGYHLRLGDFTFYHSGDCIPYHGLDQRLSRLKVDVALLPVNGRDEYRRSRKVPGNFTIPEAVALCKQAGVPILFAHHWGMFDFNTVSEETLKAGAASACPELNFIIPNPFTRYEFRLEVHATLAKSKKEDTK
jgi:L-ascorbate metabolism protein UlaG (beta-lactamase superfamily)